MNLTFAIPAALALLAIGSFAGWVYRHLFSVQACNDGAVGTHDYGRLTRYAEGELTTLHVLMKKGTAEDEVLVCGATDKPLGFLQDEATGDREMVTVQVPLGSTVIGVAGVATIAAGDDVFTGASGKLTDVPVAGCYHVGQALTTPAADGDEFELAPINFGAPYRGAVAPTLQQVLHVKKTLTGTAATESVTLAGVLATDLVSATISDNLTNDDVALLEAKAAEDAVDLLFSEAPGAAAVVDIIVFRAL